MAILQLDPIIPVVTPLGEGLAYFLWSTGADELHWGVCQTETSESWWFKNSDIRYNTNLSMGRPAHSPMRLPVGMTEHAKRYSAPASPDTVEP